MPKLGKSGYSRLKAVHIFFVSTWLGGGVCLLLLLLVGLNGKDISGMLEAIRIVDLFVIIPAAVASLITGILFLTMTSWGFFKHRWIIAKYVINLLPVCFGGIVLAPNLLGMIEIAHKTGTKAVLSPAFIYHKNIFTFFVMLQFILLVVALYLSVFKPRMRLSSCSSKD